MRDRIVLRAHARDLSKDVKERSRMAIRNVELVFLRQATPLRWDKAGSRLHLPWSIIGLGTNASPVSTTWHGYNGGRGTAPPRSLPMQHLGTISLRRTYKSILRQGNITVFTVVVVLAANCHTRHIISPPGLVNTSRDGQ